MTLPPDEAGEIANLVVQTKFVSSSIISCSVIPFSPGGKVMRRVKVLFYAR